MELDRCGHRALRDVERRLRLNAETWVDVFHPAVVHEAGGVVLVAVNDQLLVGGGEATGIVADVGHPDLDREELALGDLGSERIVHRGRPSLHAKHLELEFAVAHRRTRRFHLFGLRCRLGARSGRRGRL